MGVAVDLSEHFSGVMFEPGHRRRQQDGRILKRLMRHRAAISDELLERLELPRGMVVSRARVERDR